MEIVRLFVYGTLKRGCRASLSQLPYARYEGRALLQGYKMLDLGSFPGIVPGDEKSYVLGELFLLPGAALRFIDDYEGVDAGLYKRELLQVKRLDTDDTVDAYMYIFTSRVYSGNCPDCEVYDWDCIHNRINCYSLQEVLSYAESESSNG